MGENVLLLPDTFLSFFNHMKTHDLLYRYQYKEAIEKSFAHLAHRAKYLSDSANAFAVFEDNINHFQPYYDEFFPQLKEYAAKTFEELINMD